MPKGVYERKPDSRIHILRVWTPERDQIVRQMYLDGQSLGQIAKHFGSTARHVLRSLKRTNTPRRGKGHPGSKNHAWKGGRNTDKAGYILIHCPSHPHATAGGYVREHRLVMESLLKRHLEPGEVVHHKNGNNSDNRPENLLLFVNNATHLAVELKGKTPKWTEDGLKRIQSRKAPSMKGNVRRPNGHGVRALRKKWHDQYGPETSGASGTEPEARIPPIPPGYARPKKKRGKAPP